MCARGPYTLRGYYGAAEHNAKAFTPALLASEECSALAGMYGSEPPFRSKVVMAPAFSAAL